jgi:hypothetical protein
MDTAIEMKHRDDLTVAVLQVLTEFEPVTKTEIIGHSRSSEGKARGARFRELVADKVNTKVTIRDLEPVLTDLMNSQRVVADINPGQRSILRIASLSGHNQGVCPHHSHPLPGRPPPVSVK